MAIALVQTASNGAFAASTAVTLGSAVTPGSQLIVFLCSGGTFSSLADNQGNVYTPLVTLTGGFGPTIVMLYICYAPVASVPTITFTTTSSNSKTIIVREYSGLAASSFDVTQNNNPTSGTLYTSNATPSTTQADELVLGCFTLSGTGAWTAGTGYGNIVNQTGGGQVSSAMEDKIVSVIGTQTATATNTSGQARAVVATFKAAAGAVSTGKIKVYNGSAFVAKPVKVWNGSAWVVKPVKRWSGSAWVTTPY